MEPRRCRQACYRSVVDRIAPIDSKFDSGDGLSVLRSPCKWAGQQFRSGAGRNPRFDRNPPDRFTASGGRPGVVPQARKNPSGAAVEVALQRMDLEIAPEIGLDTLRRGDGT